MDDSKLAITQDMILAAADELWRSGIVRPDAEPTAVMVALTRMLHIAFKHRAKTFKQALDLDPGLARSIFGG